MRGAILISHSLTRHVHNLMKSQLYTYFGSEGRLVLAFIGCRVRWAMHAIQEKTTMHFGSLVWTPNPTSN